MNGLEHEDIQTGVLYGFFEQILHICLHPKVRSNKIMMFADSRQSYRHKQFADYKKKRHEELTPEEIQQLVQMYKQIDLLREEWLPVMGVPVLRQTGLESDDLIAQAALQVRKKEPRHKAAIIVTADGDLYQCITDEIHWFDPQRELYLEPGTFWAKKGIDSNLWGEVKAIAGCTSDQVPGVRGVGEKTAIDFLLGRLPKHLKRCEAITCPLGRRITKQNRRLVVLPHEQTKPVKLQAPDYKAEAFFTYCEEYGFDSYLNGPRRRQWESFFKGNLDGISQVPRRRGEER